MAVWFSVNYSEGQNDVFKDRLYAKTVRWKVQKNYRIDINLRNKILKFHIRNSDTRKY